MHKLIELEPGDCFSLDGSSYDARIVANGVKVPLPRRKYIILQSNDNEIRFAYYNLNYIAATVPSAIYYLDLNDKLDAELSEIRCIKLIVTNCIVSQLIIATRLRYNNHRFKELYYKKINYGYE